MFKSGSVCLLSPNDFREVIIMGVKLQEILVSDGRRRSGWFWVDNEIFDMGLNPTTFVVYCFLIRIADRSSEVACISARKMAKFLNMSPITVRKALKELEKLNMLKKIPRKTEKGNNLANLYQLTAKEDWKYPNPQVGQKMTQGGSKNDPGVGQKMTQGGSKNGTPPSLDFTEVVEPQRTDESNPPPINTYNDQKPEDQKSIDQHHHHRGAGDDGKIQNLKLGNGINGAGQSLSNSGRKTSASKNKKPSALKDSADSRKAEDPREIYNKLLEKWQDVLEGVELERLSVAQVIFFLENSALPPEQTLEAILRDDRNPNIKNPVGTLYSTLPMKDDRYRWLLKMVDPPSIEDEAWYQRYISKLEAIKEFFDRLGIVFNDRKVKTEEEALEHLKELERIAFKELWNKLDSERRKELKEKVRKILGERDMKDKSVVRSVFMSMISKEFGLPQGVFSLYTC